MQRAVNSVVNKLWEMLALVITAKGGTVILLANDKASQVLINGINQAGDKYLPTKAEQHFDALHIADSLDPDFNKKDHHDAGNGDVG